MSEKPNGEHPPHALARLPLRQSQPPNPFQNGPEQNSRGTATSFIWKTTCREWPRLQAFAVNLASSPENRLPVRLFFTAMDRAFRCPITITNLLPRVMPV